MKRQRQFTSGNKSSGNRESSSPWPGILIAAVIILLVLAGVLWFTFGRANHTGQRLSLSDAMPARPTLHTSGKPSAGRPIAVPGAPATATAAPQTPNLPSVSTPSPAVVPASAANPLNTSVQITPWPAEGKRFAAERRGARNGCKSGSLWLQPTGLAYECTNDGSKSVAVSLEQLKGLDDDGIEALPHEKYHFRIDGQSKDDTRALFADWKLRTSSSYGGPPK